MSSAQQHSDFAQDCADGAACVPTCSALRVAVYPYDLARTAYELYQVIISVKVILVCMLCFPFLSVWQPLGVLIIVVTRMVHDMTTFIVLLFVVRPRLATHPPNLLGTDHPRPAVISPQVMLGFSASLDGLQRTGLYENADRTEYAELAGQAVDPLQGDGKYWQSEAWGSTFWAVYGEVEPGAFVSMRKHGWVPALVLWIYVMVASVSLVNLLVAMCAAR